MGSRARRIECIRVVDQFKMVPVENTVTADRMPATHRLYFEAASILRSDPSLHMAEALAFLASHNPELSRASWAEELQWMQSDKFRSTAATLDHFQYFELGETREPRQVDRLVRSLPHLLGLRPFTVRAGTWGFQPHRHFHATETIVTKEHLQLAAMIVFSRPAWEHVQAKEMLRYVFASVRREAERLATQEKERGQCILSERSSDAPVSVDRAHLSMGERLDNSTLHSSTLSSHEDQARARLVLERLLREALLATRSNREIAVLSRALLHIENDEPVDLNEIIEEVFPKPPGAKPRRPGDGLDTRQRDVKRRVLSRLRLVAGGPR